MLPPVQVRGLSKRYRLPAARAPGGGKRGGTREIWALKDVSFDVAEGEILGIIGRNGAGKSTLLKVLSRITEPTEGWAEVRGRVSSLLEVGTGFHGELTGRENAFLSGTILGMRRQEIARKLDAIVDFAEIPEFIDVPVKHYSSGMYLRLAFAVAAHLEPDILIVDEVLAVGDAGFQKKCVGKLDEDGRRGRTILFVSHGMDAMRRLCHRVLWLEGGRVHREGEAATVIGEYVFGGLREGAEVRFEPPRALANGIPLVLHAVRTTDGGGAPRAAFSRAEPVHVEIEWSTSSPLYKPRVGFVLQTGEAADVLTALDAASWALSALPPGRRVSRCVLPARLLNEGTYYLDVGADAPRQPGGAYYPFPAGRTGPILRFEVEDDSTHPAKYYGEEGFRDARWPGLVMPEVPWTQTPTGTQGGAA